MNTQAPEYAVEVKGLELPMHDPRFSWGHAISYSTGNRGGCHLTSLAHAYELALTFPEVGLNEPAKGRVRDGKAELVVNLQNFMNEDYQSRGFGATSVTPANPRAIYASLEFRQ